MLQSNITERNGTENITEINYNVTEIMKENFVINIMECKIVTEVNIMVV